MIRQNGQGETVGERLIGLEKECLRVSAEGTISQRPHPRALGAALTNPVITTDFSEALLEIVTPPFNDVRETLDFLCQAQRFVHANLEDGEFLWSTSMPCVLNGESSIRVAQYGSSNAGRMKTIYRDGLGLRYGKSMQVIAGVHFNFSFSDSFWRYYRELAGSTLNETDFISEQYFHLIRNLLRYGWLVPYLFGASPAICKTFLGDRPKPPEMDVYNHNTYYERYGTSLRMGDIGYTNKKEGDAGARADYSAVAPFVGCLYEALTRPHEKFSRLGLKNAAGEYQQLSTTLLQIENEYYSTVRPKQIPDGNEMPMLALLRRGVRYVELRSLDVNAYHPLGISEEQVRFVEILMLFALCQESPLLSDAEQKKIDYNMNAVAHRGREPGLCLHTCERGEIPLRDYGSELMDAMTPFAEFLDSVYGSDVFSASLLAQKAKFLDPNLTPSAHMIEEMLEQDGSFYGFALRKSLEHKAYFEQKSVNAGIEAMLREQAATSLQKQAAMEAADTQSLDAYLADYFKQLRCDELAAYREANGR
ncbi:glutamate--cysteine ligase [Granulosicoccaceae sp. 1_MG-2023]|nr:glutamate--cysteine ligase [Granulosicoccaceae sp. 1_MG-2023]